MHPHILVMDITDRSHYRVPCSAKYNELQAETIMFAIQEFRVVRYLSFLLHPPNDVVENAHWSNFAHHLQRAPFIVWLANEVATQLILRKPHNLTMDSLIASVDDDSAHCVQHEAERFLEHHLGLFRYDPAYDRIIMVFRHVIQHKLRHLPQ